MFPARMISRAKSRLKSAYPGATEVGGPPLGSPVSTGPGQADFSLPTATSGMEQPVS
jgi:hypothetical protein